MNPIQQSIGLKRANLLLFAITSLVVVFIAWASMATLEEITHAKGRVIPSSQIQIVQNLEGGIVKEILVEENQIVEEGDVLLKIDDTGFASNLEENKERYLSLQARISRLEAEIKGVAPEFSQDLLLDGRKYIQNENHIYYAKQDEIEANLNLLRQQILRKVEEIEGLRQSKDKMVVSLNLLERELKLTEPLVAKRIISEVDLLDLKRKINDLRIQIDNIDNAILKGLGENADASNRIREYKNTVQRRNIEELSKDKDEFARLTALMKAAKDRVTRTTVRSPVKGSVKRILVNTVGGVVRPGMDLVEIVPLEDTLKIEAEVRPRDIAFLKPNQKVLVKISAYDFSIYGGLDAYLERISVDSIRNENNELVYKVTVRTNKNYLGTDENPLPIIPGMVADVNIMTGEKTVLDYLLKPILKAKNNALRER